MPQLADFEEVWLADFEFTQPPRERPTPLCLVARELYTGRRIRLWQDDLWRYLQAPFRTDPDAPFVAYLASAELGCFLALGCHLPRHVLDLYAEFRLLTSGLPTPCGHGLLGALAYFGLRGGVDELMKDAMRLLAQCGGPYAWQERADLLAYCETDVDAPADLLPAMRAAIEDPPNLPLGDRDKALGQALRRGDYLKALAHMERRGVPIDVPALATLRGQWQGIERALIARVDGAFGVYDGEHFDTAAFERHLARNVIGWPRFPDGRPRLDRETFKDMAAAYPTLAPLHELRATLAQMRDWKLAVGADGRNRCILADLGEKHRRGYSPFGAKTGRNTPSNSQFIVGLATWLRSLIRPEPGTALAYLDYEQQEFGIAPALSGDRNMMDAYRSSDPYLAFARQAGAVPPDATKETHGAARDQFKTCALGIQYAMGADARAYRLGAVPSRGRELLQLHLQTYPDYWRWSEACVAHGMLRGHLTAAFGWCVYVGPDIRPTTLRNFLLQANGAEMLRLACILAAERRLPVCCPIHDALLIEGRADDIDGIVAQAQAAMREASELVLPGFPLRTEAKVFRWPDRFADRRGRAMWETVQALMKEMTNPPPGMVNLSRRRDTTCPTEGLFPVPPAGHLNSLLGVPPRAHYLSRRWDTRPVSCL
jgi:hypothetical protein